MPTVRSIARLVRLVTRDTARVVGDDDPAQALDVADSPSLTHKSRCAHGSAPCLGHGGCGHLRANLESNLWCGLAVSLLQPPFLAVFVSLVLEIAPKIHHDPLLVQSADQAGFQRFSSKGGSLEKEGARHVRFHEVSIYAISRWDFNVIVVPSHL